MKAPFEVETDRLVLRPPTRDDARAIFEQWGRDTTVTRFLSFPTHEGLNDTLSFISMSQDAWRDEPAGPYLVFRRSDDRLLGSTGLDFETRYRASTGYVFAHSAWGHGYATEVVDAMLDVARELGVQRLHAEVHPDHEASRRVLEKAGFHFEGVLRCHTEFPNLDPGVAADVAVYAVGRRPEGDADWQRDEREAVPR